MEESRRHPPLRQREIKAKQLFLCVLSGFLRADVSGMQPRFFQEHVKGSRATGTGANSGISNSGMGGC